MYMRPSQPEELFAARTSLLRRTGSRYSASHMESHSSPDRPSNISADGFYDGLSVELHVDRNASENTSSLTLRDDHLTIRIPPPRANVQSTAVGYNVRRRRISSSSRRTSSDSSDCSPPKQSCKPQKALDDFLRLFNNPESFPDATLKCGDTEIPVHKCILSVRSPVFEALFKSQMKEGHNGIVDIVDIEPDVLEAMLKFVYCGKTDHITAELAEDLLFAADKYQIDGLKLACIKCLKMSMTQDNILRILVLGEMHDEYLKEYAMGYIARHVQFSEVENTEEWKELQTERSKLAMEVLLAVVKNLPKDVCSDVKIDTVITNQS